MPRKNDNARTIKRARPITRPRAVLIKLHRIKDNISPGRLVAAAEWR